MAKVLLLHAFPHDERMWEPQHEVLAGTDWVAPSLYRLGGSSIAAWARTLLEEVPGELVAVGASMGGYCALELARQAPERVRGLLLVGSRAGPDSAERRASRDEAIRTLRDQGVEGWRASAPFEPAGGHDAGDFIRATEALRDRADSTGVVEAFPGPLVLVVGEHDQLLSVEEARAIVAAAPQARLEVIHGAGHIASRDQPERFNAILRRFLREWT